ncbi:hypothetical protein DICVIV_13802 [Dictyocaulus viviparus]|uniref:Uncharacterized protein n=1 Tax=Dictyocaulus viviparus TaxID=29172 RepID=A0A0D8X6X9_DICVI|nr:hypothetical protein DICVIV_13802 [Dictyocaulus viviparus]
MNRNRNEGYNRRERRTIFLPLDYIKLSPFMLVFYYLLAVVVKCKPTQPHFYFSDL